MPSSISLAQRAWSVGSLSRTFDSPPVNSRGYSVAVGNRPNWPAAPCLRILVELSFDGGAAWQPDSENTFSGAVVGKGGVPIASASVAGEWPTVMVDGAPVIRRPTDVRVTATVLAAFTAPLAAGWTL